MNSSESAPQLPDTRSSPSKSQGPMAAKQSRPRSVYAPQTHNVNHRPQQCDSFRNRNDSGDDAYLLDNRSRHYNIRGNFIVTPPPSPPPYYLPPPPPPYSLPPQFGGPFNGPRETDAYVPFIPPPCSFPSSPPPYSLPPHFGGPFNGPRETDAYIPFIPPPCSFPPSHPYCLSPQFGGPFNGPPETQTYVPLVPPRAHVDPELQIKIVNQIDYYFSFENLVKDIYLRQNMDKQGWVPVELIASFKRVMALTENIYLILDAVRASSVVQVRGHSIRRRMGWKRWILPPSFHITTNDITKLAEKIQSISLDDTTNNGQDHVQPAFLAFI